MPDVKQVIKTLRATQRAIEADDLDQARLTACRLLKELMDDVPTLGIDLDGTIDEAPAFFRVRTKTWPGRVVIITARNDETKAIHDANSFGVRFDMLRMVRRLEDKAAAIEELGVDVYIDDQDECLMDIPPEVTVFKIRNDGNFEELKWLYSSRTGTNIEL
jgi:uncharacterized HAD superfamily protein